MASAASAASAASRWAGRTVLSSQPKNHSATLILHHGFGADAANFASALRLPPQVTNHVKIVLPQAKDRVNNGEKLPAWFNIVVSDHSKRTFDGTEDEAGMEETLDDLKELIEIEQRQFGIKPERIVVGGFSQGAAVAILQGLTRPEPIAGIAVLSGYLPLQWKITKLMREQAKALPAFWAHGKADQTIKYEVGHGAAETLRKAGMDKIEFHGYEGMQHESCPEEMSELGAWLLRTLPPA